MDSEAQQDIASVSEDILRYLREHPQAADTLEGIVEWWLSRQPDAMTREQAQHALDHLVARGFVTKTVLANARMVYASTAENG